MPYLQANHHSSSAAVSATVVPASAPNGSPMGQKTAANGQNTTTDGLSGSAATAFIGAWESAKIAYIF